VQSHQGINPETVDEADVFAIHQEGGQVCIQVFFFRTGQNWGNRAYFPKADPALEAAEVLGSFLAQFYDDKPTPRTILLSHVVEDQELLAEALSTRAGRKVAISVPQRGEKKDLTDNALQNAREALGRRLAETSTQGRLLAGFAETFGLAKPPVRIEVYDNSHIMGTNAVGAMVVAGPEGFVKNQYRKFNIRSTEITPGDDFGMMREVMERRFSRLLKEHGDVAVADGAVAADEIEDDVSGSFPAWPDVILIDGGQGQMTAVRKILADLGIEDRVVAIGIAKGQDRDAGRERFFVRGRDSFSLPVRDPVLYFVQRLRDEVHRHRHAPCSAQEGDGQESARRDQRHWPRPQACAAPAFRYRQGGQPRRGRGSGEGRWYFGASRETGLQPFSRELMHVTQKCAGFG
jgi:excinuclease ABC subunit C